jgi:ubiquinone/menaquinone biosynthesis C-methylase UbiE
MSQLRGDYKSVWNALSGSKEAAYRVVSGYTDEEKFHADAEDTVDILRETVGIRSDDVILEIGCGVGRVGRVLSPFVREWIGCDVSANMLRLASRRLLGLPNVRLQEISGYDLSPIADASIDVVYTTVVFMHLEEWDRYNYILEAMRVLKPGGRFYCDNFDLASERGWAVFEETRREFKPHERPAQISKCSTIPEIDTFLRRAGFTDVLVARRLDFWVYGWGVKPGGSKVVG